MTNLLAQKSIQNEDKTNTQELEKLIESSLFLAKSNQSNGQKTLIITKDDKELKYLTSLAKNLFDSKDVVVFNHWEILFYDNLSPSLKVVHQRLDALYQISQKNYELVLTSIEALITPVCSPSYIAENIINWKKGSEINLDNQLELFERSGYLRVSQVDGEGQFAIRGSIIDLFLVGEKYPYRIDLFDDEIETIRVFDVEDQQTISQLDEIKIYPPREFSLNEKSAEIFKKRYFQCFLSETPEPVIEKIKKGRYVAGLENYLPLFSKKNYYLWDHLESIDSIFTFDLETRIDQINQEIQTRYLTSKSNREQNLSGQMDSFEYFAENKKTLKPENFYLSKSELNSRLDQSNSLNQSRNEAEQRFKVNHYQLSDQLIYKNDNNLKELEKIIDQGTKVLFAVNSKAKEVQMIDALTAKSIRSKSYQLIVPFIQSNEKVAIIHSHLSKSLRLIDCSASGKEILIISEFDYHQTSFSPALLDDEISEKEIHHQYKIEAYQNQFELIEGCTVVHEDYGIGKYLGLEKLDLDANSEQEYLKILYANDSKVLVPVSDIGLIGRYKSDDQGVELNQIGSKKWQSRKKKVAYQIKELATELLASEAKRQRSKKEPYPIDQNYQKFAEQFQYQPTFDQQKAIDEVLSDLASSKPMNRLISGDVGFGKTEVAMRAAFVCVNQNKQVIVLTPTTLLNQQHYLNFLNRFSDFAINIAQISRLISEKQNQQTLERFERGEIDILIATHKILYKSIHSKKLALMVIDEEHRFGVAHKEKIKKMKSNLNVLTMTATPIPRTLNMAMNRLQDISIIASPPEDRLSIQTIVTEWDDGLLRQACEREIHRAGQIYWVQNNINSMPRVMKIIQALMPEAKIAITHGQMNKNEIDQTMYHFYQQNIDILLCTTIIETGIDIANANTIIINGADKLGLSQLYQLRGRVGRSHHQAYAYLLTEPIALLKKDAKRRLEAMQKANYLGAGFELASYDLEIRGSGDLLGKMQSGNIHGIGLDLYQKLLTKTINAIEAGHDFDFDSIAEKVGINLNIDAYLPEKYIQDIYLRLVLYKKIADSTTLEKTDQIYKELIDRFGVLPESAKNLLNIQRIKIIALALGIEKISQSKQRILLKLKNSHHFDINKVVSFISNSQGRYTLNPKGIEFVIQSQSSSQKSKNSQSLSNLNNDIATSCFNCLRELSELRMNQLS